MPDEFSMTCNEINKRLKAFLEDLLTEEEHQAFLRHLDSCSKCREHARSIGSLTNQLWKLGNAIMVPADFSSAVIFKLKHPTQVDPKPGFVISKKLAMGILIAIIVISAFLFGIIYFKTRVQSGAKNEAPLVKVQIIEEEKIPGNEEEKLLPEELETVDKASEVSEKEEAVEDESKAKAVARENKPLAQEASVTADQTPEGKTVSVLKPLHWHFVYSQEFERTKLEEKKRQKEQKINQILQNVRQLEGEVRRLEEEPGIELGRQYSEEAEKARLEEKRQQNELELQQKRAEIQLQEVKIKLLKEENDKIELELQQGLEETRRKEAEYKARLLNILNTLDIRLDHQTPDLLILTAQGQKIERLLEQALFTSQKGVSLQDYTTGLPTLTDKEYRISIYLQEQGTSALHWHIGPILSQQKSNLFAAIREKGGSIDYEMPNLVVFSVPRTKVDELRARIKALRVVFSEFGQLEPEEGQLSSSPVEISLYFTK